MPNAVPRQEDSPETLGCATNLAAVLGMTGQLGEATAICRDTLEAKSRVLGPEHSDTLGAAINLGGLLTEQVPPPIPPFPLIHPLNHHPIHIYPPTHPPTHTPPPAAYLPMHVWKWLSMVASAQGGHAETRADCVL